MPLLLLVHMRVMRSLACSVLGCLGANLYISIAGVSGMRGGTGYGAGLGGALRTVKLYFALV